MTHGLQHCRPILTRETEATTLPDAEKPEKGTKKSSLEAHDGNSPKTTKPVPPAIEARRADCQPQDLGSEDEEPGSGLEEDSSDGDGRTIDDEAATYRKNRTGRKYSARQTPYPAQNEIAKIIRQRAVRRLATISTYRSHPGFGKLPVMFVCQRYFMDHELADTRRDMFHFWGLWDIEVQIRDRGGQLSIGTWPGNLGWGCKGQMAYAEVGGTGVR
ncbi:hypothetical protein FKW77_004940 [Venturia effusa]|uniref:Uncharacterized protein n=1 Tax=Venturia effusa TaxID=50376 RepID=A0A517L1A4_9PEZI|nr:hypothetical protein FKW77_004940 [Venturia effusa]